MYSNSLRLALVGQSAKGWGPRGSRAKPGLCISEGSDVDWLPGVDFRAKCQSCSHPQGSGVHGPGLGLAAPSQSPRGSWGSTSGLPLLCLHQSAASRSLPWWKQGAEKREVRGGHPLPPRVCDAEVGPREGAGPAGWKQVGVPKESSESQTLLGEEG